MSAAADNRSSVLFWLISAVALPVHAITLAFFLIAIFRAFVLADVASVMSGAHVAVEILFITLGIFAVWFANRMKSMVILK